MEDTKLEGEVHQLVTHAGLRRWKKRYLIVKRTNLMLYEKQEDVNNPSPLLKVSLYEIKEITEANFIGVEQGKINCGFKVDYGGHHSLSLQAASQEERGKLVKGLQTQKVILQEQSTPIENKSFFGVSSTSYTEISDSCLLVDTKDPLGLVGKEDVVQREGYEGTCSVRLLYSDGSIQHATLSSNMTGEEVLEQVQDLSNSSRSSLFLLDTKGVVQNLRSHDKPGSILARLYGLCIVEPQNRVIVVHFPSGDWVPLILNKGVTCKEIIQSKQIKAKISEIQLSHATLFIRKSAELQSISSHTAGEVQLTQQDCPAELLYTQTQDGVEPKQTTLILRQSTGSMAVSKTERNRTMTIKDKYALLSAPLTSVGKQRNFETIYDEAIENLENDPLQSSVIVRKIDQEGFADEYLNNNNNSKMDEGELSVMEASVEILPASEPRGRLVPLSTSSPSKTEGVKKLLGKTFHQKWGSKDEPTIQPAARRTRAKAVSFSEDEEHKGYVDSATKNRLSGEHPFEMSMDEHTHTLPTHHYTPPSSHPIIQEEHKPHFVRPSSLAPTLTAQEIARHVTSAKTPDEENTPLSPTSITLQEIAKYPTIKNNSWQLMANTPIVEGKDNLNKNTLMSDLLNKANANTENKPIGGAIKVDARQPIMIPSIQISTSEARVFHIISPALLRTWVLSRPDSPPPKIQLNKSILEWKTNKWVLAANSQYSDVNATNEENKSIFKLAGDIELVYYDKSKTWSVTGPKVIRYVQPPVPVEKKISTGPKTNFIRTKIEFTRQAVAQYSNIASRDDELGFNDGEVMFIVSEISQDWLMCENKEGKRGLVPVNYVLIQECAPTPSNHVVKGEEIVERPPAEEKKDDEKKSEEIVPEPSPETPDETEPVTPEPVIDAQTRMSLQLKEKIKLLENAIDPIIWHSGATRDPEMKKQLLDDRKTPAVAVLIRGNLTSALAQIILKGLKAKSSFFQIENNSIWSVVLETVKYKESIPACESAYKAVEDICILSEVTNTLGSSSAKFRSFICQALNNKFLESWLYSVFFDLGGLALERFYEMDSFVFCSRHAKIQPLLKEMLLIVQPLDALGFQLSINFEREAETAGKKWFGSSGIGRKFGDLFMKTMTQPITPIGTSSRNVSRASSRENLSINHTMTSMSVPSSPTGENNRLFVTPGESIRKGNVTVDTATDVALADPSYTRTIGPRRSIDQLNKIVGESTKQEETPQDVKT